MSNWIGHPEHTCGVFIFATKNANKGSITDWKESAAVRQPTTWGLVHLDAPVIGPFLFYKEASR